MMTRAAGVPGRKNPVSSLPLRVERLHALLRPRHVGDDESAVGRDVEAGRLNDAAVFLADLQNLARRRLVRRRPCARCARADRTRSSVPLASCWKLIVSS